MHTYSKIFLLVTFVSAGLIMSRCVNDDSDEKKALEAKLIKNYLDANGISTDTKTPGGIYYVEVLQGTGLSPVSGDYVVVNYTGRYIENNEIHETTDESLKTDWSKASLYSNYVYGPVKFKAGYSLTGINEGLSLMKEGGKALLVLPSATAFHDYVPLVYDMELLKVIKEPESYEDTALLECRTTFGYDSSTFYNGIWYKETNTITDDQTVENNDTVYFTFKGKLVDWFEGVIDISRIFDTNGSDSEPVKWVFGKSAALTDNIVAIPSGLVTAIDSMRKGSEATIILPYNKAFKEAGLIHQIYRYTIVPPYQTIMYDIKIQDIKRPVK